MKSLWPPELCNLGSLKQKYDFQEWIIGIWKEQSIEFCAMYLPKSLATSQCRIRRILHEKKKTNRVVFFYLD